MKGRIIAVFLVMSVLVIGASGMFVWQWSHMNKYQPIVDASSI